MSLIWKKLVEQMRLVVIKRKQELCNLFFVIKSIIIEVFYMGNDIVKVSSPFMNFFNHIKFLV
jgi:hypothetical protein